MFSKKEVWGLDIGHSAVKAVKIRRSGKSLTLLDFEINDVNAPGVPMPAPGAENTAMHQTVGRFFAEKKGADKTISVSIPGNTAFTRYIGLPAVEKRKIKELVRYEASQNIPFPIDEVIWRYNIVGGIPGLDENVGLVAVRKDVVKELLERFSLYGETPAHIQPAPLAIYNFIQYDMQPEEPILVLDIGEEFCDLIVINEEDYWPRSLPVAGRDITKTLVDKFKVSKEEAEDLKRKLGGSKQAEKVFGTLEPVLRNLVGEIQRSVGFYKSQHSALEFKEMYVFGGTAILPGFNRFLERELGIKVKVIDQFNRIQVGRGIDPALVGNYLRELGVAIGLAVQGLGLARMNINLMPDEYLEKKKASTKRPFGIAGVALISIALLVRWYASTVGLERTEEEFKEMNLLAALSKQYQEQERNLVEINNSLEVKTKALPVPKRGRDLPVRLYEYVEKRWQFARDNMFEDKETYLIKENSTQFNFFVSSLKIDMKYDDAGYPRYTLALHLEVPIEDEAYRTSTLLTRGSIAKKIYEILCPSRNKSSVLKEAGLPDGDFILKEDTVFLASDENAMDYSMDVKNKAGEQALKITRKVKLLTFKAEIEYIPLKKTFDVE